MHPVSYLDLDMPNVGENYDPPSEYSFTFKAGMYMFNPDSTKIPILFTCYPDLEFHSDHVISTHGPVENPLFLD